MDETLKEDGIECTRQCVRGRGVQSQGDRTLRIQPLVVRLQPSQGVLLPLHIYLIRQTIISNYILDVPSITGETIMCTHDLHFEMLFFHMAIVNVGYTDKYIFYDLF